VRDNLDRLAAALAELGAFLRIGGMADEQARALPVVIDGRSLEGMEVSMWRTEADDLDVLHHLRGDHGDRLVYETLEPGGPWHRDRDRRRAGALGGLADIAASKRFADRDKDRAALPEPERLLRESGE
jgi:hypothetical protein